MKGDEMKSEFQFCSRMRMMRAILASLLAVLTGCAPFNVYHSRGRDVVKTEVYGEYDVPELNQYGEWISVPRFGRVWRPYVIEGWRPFYHGHWAYADESWLWVSYEPFGWITYHYGNWFPTPEHGWIWVPGHGAWSPARVQWVQYDDYLGWAPLPPAGVTWSHPWERSELDVWAVVHTRDITRDFVGERRIARSELRSDVRRERVIEKAPEPRAIERQTRKKIESVRIDRETVVVGKGQFHKVVIPASEKERVEKYRSKVEKEVVKRPDQGEHR
jgi:hypothetical protein